MFAKKVIESMGMKVATPMLVNCDNKGAVDLLNGHSVGGNSKHIDVRILHVRDLKEKEVIKVEWIPTEENESDMNTKNTGSTLYNKHVKHYVGNDEYNAEATEAVGTQGLIPNGIDHEVQALQLHASLRNKGKDPRRKQMSKGKILKWKYGALDAKIYIQIYR